MRLLSTTTAILIAGSVGFLAGRATTGTTDTPPDWSPASATSQPSVWPVVRVIDGDTLVVRYRPPETIDEGVRLLNVNTPERGKPGYREAADALRRLVVGHEVRLEFEKGRPDRGAYGRLTAYVFVGDVNVNLELVRLGWSAFYTKYGRGRYPEAFEQAEREARAAGRGLWGLDEKL